MKSIYAILLAFPFVVGISLYHNTTEANHNGAPAGHTGSPGDGKTCQTSGCHSDASLDAGPANMLTSDVPATGWELGKEYEITAYSSSPGGGTIGFQACVEDENKAKVGTLTSGVDSKLTGSGNNYITHSNSSASNNEKTWKFKWKAPSDATRKVTVYAAFNNADGTGTANSDRIVTRALVLTANATGISAHERGSLKVFPNPCMDILNASGPHLSKLVLRDLSGRNLAETSTSTTLFGGVAALSVSGFNAGVYLAELFDGDGELLDTRVILKY
jgi:hypothetical protein